MHLDIYKCGCKVHLSVHWHMYVRLQGASKCTLAYIRVAANAFKCTLAYIRVAVCSACEAKSRMHVNYMSSTKQRTVGDENALYMGLN